MIALTRRRFTAGLAAGSLGLALPARAGTPRRGGTLTMVIQPEPPILVSLTHTAGPTTRLLEAAVETDPDRRRGLFFGLQAIIGRDLPDVNLVTGANLTILNRRVANHPTTIDGPSDSFADIWLDA